MCVCERERLPPLVYSGITLPQSPYHGADFHHGDGIGAILSGRTGSLSLKVCLRCTWATPRNATVNHASSLRSHSACASSTMRQHRCPRTALGTCPALLSGSVLVKFVDACLGLLQSSYISLHPAFGMRGHSPEVVQTCPPSLN